MIPALLPPAQHVPIEAAAARRVKRRVTALGAVLVPLAVVLGGGAAPAALLLPTGGDPIALLLAGLGCLPCLCALLLGASAWSARRFVRDGRFNVAHARAVLRMGLVHFAVALLVGAFNVALTALMVLTAVPPLPVDAVIAGYTASLLLPAFAIAAALLSLRRTFRG